MIHDDYKELRIRCQLVFNNWKDTTENRSTLEQREKYDSDTAAAWDRVMPTMILGQFQTNVVNTLDRLIGLCQRATPEAFANGILCQSNTTDEGEVHASVVVDEARQLSAALKGADKP